MGKLRTVVIKRSTLVWRNSMKNIRKGDISQTPNDIASAIRVSTFCLENTFARSVAIGRSKIPDRDSRLPRTTSTSWYLWGCVFVIESNVDSNINSTHELWNLLGVIFAQVAENIQIKTSKMLHPLSRYQQPSRPLSRPQIDLDSIQGDRLVTAVDMTRFYHEQNHILNTWRKWLGENLINSFEIQEEGVWLHEK